METVNPSLDDETIELINRIDHSLEQAKSGEGIDADEAISSLMKEFNL